MAQITDKATEVFSHAAQVQPVQTALLVMLLILFVSDMYFQHLQENSRLQIIVPMIEKCIDSTHVHEAPIHYPRPNRNPHP